MISNFGSEIRGITGKINGFITKQVGQYGIKQGQMDYFMLIADNPGINQLELSEMKNVGKSAVTKAIKILEADGFVLRKADEADRRNVKCYITDLGESILDQMKGVRNETEQILFDGFTKSELEQFYQFLKRLHNNADRL